MKNNAAKLVYFCDPMFLKLDNGNKISKPKIPEHIYEL